MSIHAYYQCSPKSQNMRLKYSSSRQLDFPATILQAKAAGYKTKVESIAHLISQFGPFFCMLRAEGFLESEFCVSISRKTGLDVVS